MRTDDRYHPPRVCDIAEAVRLTHFFRGPQQAAEQRQREAAEQQAKRERAMQEAPEAERQRKTSLYRPSWRTHDATE
jgi:hypothetical protein